MRGQISRSDPGASSRSISRYCIMKHLSLLWASAAAEEDLGRLSRERLGEMTSAEVLGRRVSNRVLRITSPCGTEGFQILISL